MKILGQEPLTEVTEEPWGLSQSPYSRLFLVLIKLTKESTKWPARSPSGISWGREWRDVAGLIIAFLLLLLLFVRKQEHFPCLCFLVLGCLFFFFFKILKILKLSSSEQVLDLCFESQSKSNFLILKKCCWKRIIEAILKMIQNGFAIIAFG